MSLRASTRRPFPALRASLALALGLTVAGPAMTGCARREVVVVHEGRGPSPCHGGVFVDGHYGRHGVWHHGHWRCPHVVEVVEVD